MWVGWMAFYTQSFAIWLVSVNWAGNCFGSDHGRGWSLIDVNVLNNGRLILDHRIDLSNCLTAMALAFPIVANGNAAVSEHARNIIVARESKSSIAAKALVDTLAANSC